MDESRKQFEQEFARIKRIPLEAVISCRYEGDYWDESHLNTRGISMAWKIWQASRESMKPSGVCVLTVTNSTGEAISISDVIGFEVVEYKGA